MKAKRLIIAILAGLWAGVQVLVGVRLHDEDAGVRV